MVKPYTLMIWSGIAALVFLTAAFSSGLTGLGFQRHKLFGIIGYSFAVIHALLVIYKYLKVWTVRRKAVAHR